MLLRKKSATFSKQLEQRNRALESFEEIANTYLKTSSPQKGEGTRSKSAKTARGSFPAWLPWTIAALAVVASLVIIVSRTYFDVSISVARKGAPGAGTAVDGKQAVFGSSDTVLVRGGAAEDAVVAKTVFLGDAQAASRTYSNEVVLANGAGRGAASYRIEAVKPLDLSQSAICYRARSETPGAKLVLILTDTANRGYRVEEDRLTDLSGKWRTYRVTPRPPKDSIDLGAISSIRFEFGSATTGNPQETTVSLKDIYLTRAKRLPWL